MTLPHDDDIHYKNAKSDESPPLPSQRITFPPPSGNKIPREAWKVVAILSSIATMVMYGETMFAGGAVIGLSIGGFIIQHYGWQATFFTIIPIVIALFFVVWRFLQVDPILQPEQQEREESEHTLKKVSSESDKKSRSTGLLKR